MVIVLIIVGLLVLLGVIYILTRNSIIAERNRCDEAWSGIDVQLKRRTTSSPTWSNPSRATRRTSARPSRRSPRRAPRRCRRADPSRPARRNRC